MNKIINKFLLNGDKFMPELHLKQAAFTYSTCVPFTKHCKRIQTFRQTGNIKHLHRNELDKTCFAHDTAYSDSKDLLKRTISDKNNIAYEIARNLKYDGYQRALASTVFKFLNEKTGSRVSVNKPLAEELSKPVYKKFKRKKSTRDLKTEFGQQI